jgi:hypothetical protein
MKDSVEMGSGDMIYTTSVMKTSFCIQEFLGGGLHSETDNPHSPRQRNDLISLLLFFILG